MKSSSFAHCLLASATWLLSSFCASAQAGIATHANCNIASTFSQTESSNSLTGPSECYQDYELHDQFGRNEKGFTESGSIAAYGSLKAFSDISGTNVTSSSFALASFDDFLTILSPGLQGRQGEITIKLKHSLSGHADYGPAVNASGSANINFVTAADRWERDMLITGGRSLLIATDKGAVVDFAPITATFQFIYGTPFFFRVDLGTSADGSSKLRDGSFNASMDASHSVYWDGISSVTAGGRLVDYSTISASGTDWARSFVPTAVVEVPEPEMLGLFAIALVALIAGERRGRGRIATFETGQE